MVEILPTMYALRSTFVHRGAGYAKQSFLRSALMQIAIESPDILSEDDLDVIIDIWNRKGRRIAV